MIYIGRLLYREFLVYFPILFNNSFQIFIARNFCCSFSSLRVMLIDSGSSSTLHLRYFTLLRILSHSIPVINFSNLVLGEQHLHVLFMGAWVAGQKKKVAVPPAPARVPRQRSLAPSVTSSHVYRLMIRMIMW